MWLSLSLLWYGIAKVVYLGPHSQLNFAFSLLFHEIKYFLLQDC